MDKRVAVIGAGPMGLSVAHQLVLDGYQPIVFEADDRLGGTSAVFDFNGIKIERYYHYYCTPDNDFFLLLKELGLTEKLHWVETKMAWWFDHQLQSWGNPIALLKFKHLSLLSKIRYGIHVFISTHRQNWQAMDKKKAREWLIEWIGLDAYNKLWRTLLEFKFYQFKDNISAAWFWSRIRRIGLSRYDLFREKLGYLEGGSETLFNAIKEEIVQHGGEIRLCSPVSKVLIKDGCVKGVVVDAKIESFSTVISTVPLPLIPKMIPDLPEKIIKAYQSIQYIGVVCVVVKLRKPVSKYFWVNINDPDMDIPGFVEFSNLRSFDQSIVYVPYYLPHDHPNFTASDSHYFDTVRSYFMKINPNLKEEDFLDFHVSRYSNAQPICTPGLLQNLPPIELPIKGLIVADTAYYYPEDRGTSESIRFGRKLAKSIDFAN